MQRSIKTRFRIILNILNAHGFAGNDIPARRIDHDDRIPEAVRVAVCVGGTRLQSPRRRLLAALFVCIGGPMSDGMNAQSDERRNLLNAQS